MPVMTINGHRIHYIDRGQGIPIILVHPPVLSSASFLPQVRHLSDTFRVIAFDIRGHGKSQASKEALTYPLIVSDVKALMDGLEIDKAFLCGYSTGASVVLESLLTYPNRSYGGILIGGLSEVHDLRLSSRILLGMAVSKLGAFRALAFGVAWSNSVPGMFLDTFNEAKQGSSKNAEQYYRYSLTYNCTNKLSHIDAPVLLVYGENDKKFHSYGNILHNCLPNNELVFIKNVKHQVPTKASNELHKEIRRFIRKII